MVRFLSILILVLGLVAIVLGGVFIGQGFSKQSYLTESMDQEQITLGMDEGQISAGEVIDTAKEAQIAGDTVREHRHSIAPTYGDLLGTGRFDPTNPEQLTYAQALNLENYLYLAVLGFGVVQIVLGVGAFMVITGIGLGATGLALMKL
jgi:hypothetical protein